MPLDDHPTNSTNDAQTPHSSFADQILSGAIDVRRHLLRATVAILQHSGEAAVDAATVAEHAGVAEATIRQQFGDLDGLIEAARAEQFRTSFHDMNIRLLNRVRKCTTGSNFVRALHITLLEIFSRDRAQFRIARLRAMIDASENPRLMRRLTEARQAGEVGFLEVLAIGRERGWVRTDIDDRTLIRWLSGIVASRALIEVDPTIEPEVEIRWNEFTLQAILASIVIPNVLIEVTQGNVI